MVLEYAAIGQRFVSWTVNDVPFEKYDVFVWWDYRDSFAAAVDDRRDECLGIGDQVRLVRSRRVPWNGTPTICTRDSEPLPGMYWAAAPDPINHILRFEEITGSTFTIDSVKASRDNGTAASASQMAYLGICAIQIRERLDDISIRTRPMAEKLIGFGDSYMAGSGGAEEAPVFMLRNLMANIHTREPSSTENRGVGGSNTTAQLGVITSTDLTNSVLLWWDGYPNGHGTIEQEIDKIDQMVAAKGNDKWFLIGPNVVPSDNLANAEWIAAYNAALAARFGPDHHFDPHSTIAATDTSDTSVHGLPASAFPDGLHLAEAPERAIVAAVIDKIYSKFTVV